jgi:hypothetical protein
MDPQVALMPDPVEVECGARAVALVSERRRAKPCPPKMDVQLKNGGAVAELKATAGLSEAVLKARIAEIFGTGDDHFATMLQAQMVRAAWMTSDTTAAVNDALSFMAGVAPENETEALLAVQMYSAHCATMKLSRLMFSAEHDEKLMAYGGLFVKTSRTFTAQVEALAKLRSGGKQQVEVVHVHKHVYVAPGGQAIVGDVHHTGAQGGGGEFGNGRQPHAPAAVAGLAFAPGVPVWGEDPGRDTMPGAGDQGQETLSDAWGPEPRCPHRRGKRSVSPRVAHTRDDRGSTVHPIADEDLA